MKKLLAFALSALMMTSTAAFAANNDATLGNIKDAVDEALKKENNTVTQPQTAPVTSFGDVKEGAWYFNTIMSMTQKGLFSGTGDVDGVPQFSPNKTMSRAEFLTVVARMLNLDTSTESEQWYEGAYYSAVDKGLIEETEMPYDSLNEGISRQEMALIAIRAMQARNEDTTSKYAQNVKNAIPDMAKVGSYYRDFVVSAYEKGILCGVDDKGTFDSQGQLTRAAATTVLYRIIEPSAREHKDFSQAVSKPSGSHNVSEAIIIRENEPRSNRLAREGDTYIKADGTVLTITKGPHGVVAEGMGIAPDLGLFFEGPQGGYVLEANDKALTNKYGVNSIGMDTASSEYWVNPLTHEGHWSSEWTAIAKDTAPQTEGTTEGEISADKNFVWNGLEWVILGFEYVQ